MAEEFLPPTGTRKEESKKKEIENVCSVPFEGCSEEGGTPYILNDIPAALGTMRFYLTTVFLHCLSK